MNDRLHATGLPDRASPPCYKWPRAEVSLVTFLPVILSEKRFLHAPVRKIGEREVGAGRPVYITGEIGINHNGELANAIALLNQAADAGCDAVKFQKRTPEVATPRDQWDIERDTPWGRMTYIDYRHRVEFGAEEYAEIDKHAKERGIGWFASPWDTDSVDFLEQFDVPAHKVASAALTDDELLITLDRAMWGSDQAASVEPPGLQRLVRDIRVISEALGDGVKKVYDGEKAAMKKLRRVPGELTDDT